MTDVAILTRQFYDVEGEKRTDDRSFTVPHHLHAINHKPCWDETYTNEVKDM